MQPAEKVCLGWIKFYQQVKSYEQVRDAAFPGRRDQQALARPPNWPFRCSELSISRSDIPFRSQPPMFETEKAGGHAKRVCNANGPILQALAVT